MHSFKLKMYQNRFQPLWEVHDAARPQPIREIGWGFWRLERELRQPGGPRAPEGIETAAEGPVVTGDRNEHASLHHNGRSDRRQHSQRDPEGKADSGEAGGRLVPSDVGCDRLLPPAWNCSPRPQV